MFCYANVFLPIILFKQAIAEPVTWNIVMASKGFYRTFAEYFLGRPASNCTELSQMNLTARFTAGVLTLSGYGKSIIQLCIPTIPYGLELFPLTSVLSIGIKEVSCSASSFSPGVNLTSFGKL